MNSRRWLVQIAAVVAVIALAAGTAFAQGGATSTIAGSVTDASGGIIPGADIVAKNNATSAESRAVSSEQGTFAIPALNAGTYTVTVTLSGFKTVVLNDVVLNAGVPSSVKAILEVGGVSETVVVQAASEVVQTQSATVASTLNATQITKLPVTSRNALDFIVNLPGVNTPGTARDSTVNGLPQGSINITLDGMNIQDNYLKTSDGFFARLSPRLDAIEEVTVTTAANGADSGGQGAVNIRFVTRSGSNRLTGSSYYYLRHDALNANTWFNNRDLTPDPATGRAPKTALRQYQPGSRVGGPIVIPGLFDGHDKAFFFVNYEETRSPSKGTLTRTIMSRDSEQGRFLYNGTNGLQSVDLLALAARNGQLATFDPTIAKLLGDIRTATGSTGSLTASSDPSLQTYNFQTPIEGFTPAPTIRLDYNLAKAHRLTGSYNYQHVNSNPDTTNTQQVRFPGFPIYGSQQSTRYSTSETLRSTFGTNVVNEVRVGATGGASLFSPEKSVTMWSGTPVADQAGFNLNINNFNGIANAGVTPTPSSREASTKNIEDTLTWIKGAHSLSFGGSFTQADLWLKNQTLVPTITFGIASGDPAEAMFTTANFAGASNAQLTNARNLYAVLTGRVLSIDGNARLNESTNQYEYMGLGVQRGRMRELGFFAQDQWRLRPNLTVNAGLRYEVQRPFYPTNSSYSTATVADVWGVSGVGNLFQPGVLTGQKPTFQAYTSGTRAYKTDWNNLAPSLNLSWTPGEGAGFLRRILGDAGDTVLRGGYALAYERPGMSDFSDVFGANPGVSITANRNTGLGNLNQDGRGLPVLLRETGRLGAPSFPLTQQYPFTDVVTGDVNVFDPQLQTPYAQTWTASVGRKVSRDIGIDVRYVGTRHLQGWTTYNFNEINIVENGFLDEFKKAQANLKANIAAGRAADGFKYTGVAGTSPLPIFLAHYNGLPASRAGDPNAYSGTNWTNATFQGFLAANNPAPYSFASTNATNGLIGNSTFRANAATAGLPVNFFLANPDLIGGANVTGNGGYTRYDSLQLEGRKRLSHGFQVEGSYAYGKAYSSNRYSFRLPRYSTLQTGGLGGVTHAFKANWVWELPFGENRHWLNTTNGLLARIVGGWELDGVVRVQSGTMADYGNVRLVGMTKEELQKEIGLYTYPVTGLNSTAATALYLLPQDIVENTVRAFNVSATTANGYSSLGAPTGRYIAPANGPDCIEVVTGAGQCGARTLVLTGPRYSRVDLSAVKRIDLFNRTNFEFRAEMLNAFNHPNFTPVIGLTNGVPSTNADNYRITGVQENSSRIVQLVFRLNF